MRLNLTAVWCSATQTFELFVPAARTDDTNESRWFQQMIWGGPESPLQTRMCAARDKLRTWQKGVKANGGREKMLGSAFEIPVSAMSRQHYVFA